MREINLENHPFGGYRVTLLEVRIQSVGVMSESGCEPLVGRLLMNDGCREEQTLESNRARYSYLKT